jgi:hypothetical protein
MLLFVFSFNVVACFFAWHYYSSFSSMLLLVFQLNIIVYLGVFSYSLRCSYSKVLFWYENLSKMMMCNIRFFCKTMVFWLLKITCLYNLWKMFGSNIWFYDCVFKLYSLSTNIMELGGENETWIHFVKINILYFYKKFWFMEVQGGTWYIYFCY